MNLGQLIRVPFSALLLKFYEWFGNYGWAILAFGLVVKLILLPFQMKSKKSMMRTTMLQPQVKELEKKYANDKQKYSEAVSKLYKDAKVKPMSGCLWSFLPLFIIFPLYQVVRQPLSQLMKLTADEVTGLTAVLEKLGYYTAPARADAYAEMTLASSLHGHFQEILSNSAVAGFADKLKDLDFTFLGLNLANKPRVFFWNFFEEYGTFAAILLFLLPFISAGLTVLQTKLTQAMTNPGTKTPGMSDAQASQAEQTAKSMNYMMPIMSVYICFIMPAAMGLYWIEQSVLGIVQEWLLNRKYKAQLDAEMAVFNEEQRKREAELEAKRAETERLRAEGKTQVNASTSKKRLAAKEKNDAEQRAAAQRAAERAAKGQTKEIPDSQVGNRMYARGRAYVADRYAAEMAAAEQAAEPVEETVAAVAEAAEETAAAVKEAAEEMTATAGEAVEEVAAVVEETAEEVTEAVENVAEEAAAAAEEITEE